VVKKSETSETSEKLLTDKGLPIQIFSDCSQKSEFKSEKSENLKKVSTSCNFAVVKSLLV
jgi:hypothetical protein